MVAGCGTNNRLLEKVDHHLFVTPPELMYLTANLGVENIKSMPTNRPLGGKCPYNIEGKCTVYEYRFAACRIFCCDADADFQSELSESALKKLKSPSVQNSKSPITILTWRPR